MTPKEAIKIVKEFACEQGSHVQFKAVLLLMEQVVRFGELDREYWWREECRRWEEE